MHSIDQIEIIPEYQPRVLIVDDEPFNLIVLEGLLNMNGITRIDKAFNGLEAFEIVTK